MMFWVRQDALAMSGVLQLLRHTQQHVLRQCSFYSFPALLFQPNQGIRQQLPNKLTNVLLVACCCRSRRLRRLAPLHERLSSQVCLHCISL